MGRAFSMALLASLVLFSGCLGNSGLTVEGGGFVTKWCDKPYPGDSYGGKVIGVFRCGETYRLVFDKSDHADYYIGRYDTVICPSGTQNEECRNLFGNCSFVNICREER